MNLSFGDFGFRKSNEIKPLIKKTLTDVVEACKNKQWFTAVRTKHSVNKEVLAEWTDAKLAMVNARRVEKDAFWYELKEEELNQEI